MASGEAAELADGAARAIFELGDGIESAVRSPNGQVAVLAAGCVVGAVLIAGALIVCLSSWAAFVIASYRTALSIARRIMPVITAGAASPAPWAIAALYVAGALLAYGFIGIVVLSSGVPQCAPIRRRRTVMRARLANGAQSGPHIGAQKGPL